MTETTATSQTGTGWAWGTAKTHKLTVGSRIILGGFNRKAPASERAITIVAFRSGYGYDYTVDSDQAATVWSIGGAATRFWARTA